MFIEIFEKYKISDEIMKLLLKDRTTNKNIFWATSAYESFNIKKEDRIKLNVLLKNNLLIKKRNEKNSSEKNTRIKELSEIFTPSWLCNKQINIVDDNWFGYENVFNIIQNNKWIPTKKIEFPSSKNYLEYISSNRMEVTCGESPYLVSRYDVVSGKEYKITERIGLLDRKLRVVNEYSNDLNWYQNCINAFKSIYAFDLQGDNVFISRINLLITFIEYYYEKFQKDPIDDELMEITNVISFNIFQMNGITGEIPVCLNCENVEAKLMNWKTNKKIKYVKLIKGVVK